WGPARSRRPAPAPARRRGRGSRRRSASRTDSTAKHAAGRAVVAPDLAVALAADIAQPTVRQRHDRAVQRAVTGVEERGALVAAVGRQRQPGRGVAARCGDPAMPLAGKTPHARRRGRTSGQRRRQQQEHRGARHRRGCPAGAGGPAPSAASRRDTRVAIQNAISVTPKAQTTVAPVGRSSAAEATMPITLTTVPNAQPISNRAATVPPSITPASAGTIREENTSSTPAIRTAPATTTPNDPQKTKSHSRTLPPAPK